MFTLNSPDSPIKFADLYQQKGLLEIDKIFTEFFVKNNSDLLQKFQELKQFPAQFSKKDQSNILIEVAKILAEFLVQIFDIQNEHQALQNNHLWLSVIYKIRRNFIQKEIARKYNYSHIENIDGQDLLKKIDPN